MRLLLWGIAAAALLATEPGKRLQQKAVDKFKELKGKTCGGEAQECDGQEKGKNAEAVDVGANGKPTKKEDKKSDKKDEKNSDSERQDGKRKLRAVSNDETDKNGAESDGDLEESRTAIKDSNERHPEMGAEENEDEAEEPRLEKDSEDEAAEEEKGEDEKDEETAEDESENEKAEEKSGDEEEHGIDQRKAAELVEKLNAKPSAPEDELKSA